MIVNDDVVVDKKSFLHKISSLRRRELAGQGLYPASTDVGEKTACRSRRRFCTSDPVHIQRLVHSRAVFRPLFAGKTGWSSVSATWQGIYGAALQWRQLALADAVSALPRSRSGLASPFVPFRQRGQNQVKQDRQDFSRLQQTRAQQSFFPQSIANASSRLFAKPFFSSVRDSVCSTAGGFFCFSPALAHFIFLISR